MEVSEEKVLGLQYRDLHLGQSSGSDRQALCLSILWCCRVSCAEGLQTQLLPRVRKC